MKAAGPAVFVGLNSNKTIKGSYIHLGANFADPLFHLLTSMLPGK